MAPKRASAKRSPDVALETPLKKSRFNFDTGLRPGGKGSQGAIELDDEAARPPPVTAAAPKPQARPAPKTSPAPPLQTTPASPLRQRSKTPGVGPQKAAEAPSSNPAQAALKFDGVSFVFTGELEQITRVEAEERVKAAGGKVGGAVSGNTRYLVVGSRLEDGRTVEETSKYRKYLELKEKGKKFPDVLREADFVALLPGKPTATSAASNGMPGTQMGALPPTFQGEKPAGADHHAWVSRHAPKSLDEVVGNASVVRKLADWLKDWGDVVLKGMTKRPAFKPGGGMPDNINARAALVSGPPGIGKTTACRLAVQLHGGYEVLEYNASDSRSQKFVQEMAAGIADNMTISFGGGGAARRPSLTRKACIIFDEVDGMGAGDRGGIAALIRMIKKTRNPIICICNDSHNPKVRNLAFSCYDLKFTRPSKNIVAQRLGQIAGREGLAIEPNALESLAESCCSDMRMVLNQMQMLARSQAVQSSTVTYMDMKERTAQIAKDQATMLSAFEACKKLLNSSEGARMSFRDRLDMFFVDYNLMDLLVHENYLRAVERKPNDMELLSRCAFSADLMAMGDIVSTRIRQDQEWSLLPDMGVFGAVFPAHITNGFVPFPSFPQHLGKYSTMGRMRRLATELQTILQLSASVAGSSLQTSGYAELLYQRAMHPLTEGGPEAAADAARVLDAYGLRKEHLMEHLTEMRQHIGGEDLFKAVDPKVKAALTREFNSGHHAVKVVLPASKKRKVAAADEADDPDGEGDEMVRQKAADSDAEPAAEDDEESDTGGGTLLKVKGGAKAKAKGKAKAKAKATGAASSREPESPAQREAASPKAKSKGRGRGRGAAKARA